MDCLLAQGLWSPLFVNMCSGDKTPKKWKKSNLYLLGFNYESDPYCVFLSRAFVWQMRKPRRLRVTQSQNWDVTQENLTKFHWAKTRNYRDKEKSYRWRINNYKTWLKFIEYVCCFQMILESNVFSTLKSVCMRSQTGMCNGWSRVGSEYK